MFLGYFGTHTRRLAPSQPPYPPRNKPLKFIFDLRLTNLYFLIHYVLAVWGRYLYARTMNMNGHRPRPFTLLALSPQGSLEGQIPRSAVSLSNLFPFIRFRTLCTQRSTRNPFPLNHFRTLSRATEGWGSSALSVATRLPRLPRSAKGPSRGHSPLTNPPLTSLECAVARTRSRNSSRMRSSEKKWGGGGCLPNARPAGCELLKIGRAHV